MTFAIEKLLVYQKSVDFADNICSATENFHRGYGFLVDQLNRAALSISSNIAEGNGRFTKADRKNFFIMENQFILFRIGKSSFQVTLTFERYQSFPLVLLPWKKR